MDASHFSRNSLQFVFLARKSFDFTLCIKNGSQLEVDLGESVWAFLC